MILCGNIFLDELNKTFSLKCVLCKKKSKRYTDFVNHIKKKHKKLEEKEASPPRPIVEKIKNEADSHHLSDGEEKPNVEVEVEIKNEMEVDDLEQFTDDIKYDAHDVESFVDPILAMEEKDSLDALDAFDSDVKDDDYAPDEPDSDDEEFQDEDGKADESDSDTEVTKLTVPTDKFTPTFYRKKRFVNDFIDLYKSQPALWDINDTMFKNTKAQKEAEIAIITGMQKFNIYLKTSSLKSAINKIHKYCNIIKTDIENGDDKKVTTVAKAYYERCDFLKDLLEMKNSQEDDNKNKPLILNQWDDKTSKFIEAYAKFPILYDGDHPLQNNFDEIQKTMIEFTNTLLSDHNIDLKDGHLSNAIEQLKSWFYIAKQRYGKPYDKLNKDEEEYFKKCKFMPAKRLKLKFTCKICNKNFNMEHNYRGHMYKYHQVGELPFECNQCGKKFDAKTTVQMHIQRMHRIRNFSCNVCFKLFALPSELKFHYMVHTAEKPHVCELCGKAFRIKTQLRYHVTAIHTKIRAYKCTMCPKDFLKKRDLTDHVKTHLNIRDKICETCGKGFSNSHSLIRHRQIHSEVKRYACKLCDAKFHQFVGLNGHMKRTHNIVKKDP